MAEITYATVKHLVKQEKVEGGQVLCVFECPQCGVRAEANAPIEMQRDVRSVAEKTVKRSLFGSLSRGISKAIGGAVGGGLAGQVARSVSHEALSGARDKASYSRPEIEGAVARAFTSVQAKFTFDEARGLWVGRPGA